MNIDTHSRKYTLVMRSRTLGKTDSEEIEVHAGQDKDVVAKRIADGYGADVVDLVEITNV